MRQSLRSLRDNIAAISAAVRASSEYTRSAALAEDKNARNRGRFCDIPI